MALIEDLTIKVKDKSATDIEYADIRQIQVPRADGGYGLYTYLHSIRPYFLKPTGEDNKFEVLNYAALHAGGFTGAKGMVVFLDSNDSAWDDSFTYALSTGNRRCVVLLVPYDLSIGDIVDTSTL